mmetsp:Transcript_15668/g.13330  ORF Transcript_15668/g.13330 Transcript_15668/m.13330 type:complete len:123 (+) Transcript_15668:189-557(+)
MLWSSRLIIDLDGTHIKHNDILRLIKRWASLVIKTGTAAKEIILTSLGQGITSLKQFHNVYNCYNETISADKTAASATAAASSSSHLLCQTIFIEFPLPLVRFDTPSIFQHSTCEFTIYPRE